VRLAPATTSRHHRERGRIAVDPRSLSRTSTQPLHPDGFDPTVAAEPMRHVVPVAHLTKMEQPYKDGALDDLVRRARTGKPNGPVSALDAQVREFEARYEMSSDEMLARFCRGEQKDTADIARWMVLLSARRRVR
jgi:hypothetical protein